MKKVLAILTAAAMLWALPGCSLFKGSSKEGDFCGVWAVESNLTNIDVKDFDKADAIKLTVAVHEDGSYGVDNPSGLFSDVQMNSTSDAAAGIVCNFTAVLTVDSSVSSIKILSVYRKADGTCYAENNVPAVDVKNNTIVTVKNKVASTKYAVKRMAITLHTKG